MVKKVYGRSWWGAQWLQALNNIDEENRIPRGRTYANKGAVLSVHTEGNEIKAKVQGSMRTPYTVQVNFKKFTDLEKEKIRKIIEKRPSIIFSLSNNNLPQNLNNLLLKAGISLFPLNWKKDIVARCSCPDYAMPCKHIAAVLYKMSELIDRDPFEVFKLRCCDLKEMISEFKINEQHHKLKSVSEFFSGRKDFQRNVDVEKLSQISFAPIKDMTSMTFDLLNEAPTFAESGFLEKLRQFYDFFTNSAKMTEVDMNREASLDICHEIIPKFEALSDVVINFDHNELAFESCVCPGEVKTAIDLSQLVHFLQSYPATYMNFLPSNLKFLYYVFLFTLQLMIKGALIPQILSVNSTKTTHRIKILFIPAIYDEAISAIVDEFVRLSPEIIKGFKSSRWQLFLLISNFARAINQNADIRKQLFVNYADPLNIAFFFGGSLSCHGPIEASIPGAIDTWLRKLYRKMKRICFVVDEKDDLFEIDLKIIDKNTAVPVNLDKAINDANSDEKFALLSDISSLASYWPEIAQIMDGEKIQLLGLNEFTGLFTNILPILRSVGVQIMLPKSLMNIITPQLALSIRSKNTESSFTGLLNLAEIADFDWQVAIGDESLSIAEFKKLLKTAKGLVKIKDHYVLIDDKQMLQILDRYNSAKSYDLNAFDILQAGLAGRWNSAQVFIDRNIEKILDRITNYKLNELPSNLKAILRPYQENGFNWLLQNIDLGFGCILADDMGLGKTLQVISVILHLKNTKQIEQEKVLIVAPSSLVINWQNEISRFAPDLRVKVYHGSKRDMNGDFDVVLTSYALIQRDIKKINSYDWFLEVIDEAQNIKNPNTKQAKAVKSVEARHKIALSGTPVENRLLDYWSIFDFTNAGYLGTKTHFISSYASPIERSRDMEVLDNFKKITAPFILRRCKTDKNVISDLPDKVENNYYYSLSKEQTALYQQVLDEQLAQVAQSEGINRKGLILKLINDLKQICNHPAQYSKRTSATVDESGKTKLLMEILDGVNDSGEKALIFTQYVQMGDLLVEMLNKKFMTPVSFFHGGLNLKKKQEIIDTFQNTDRNRILIVSLKAGGSGLNLTAASHVIHYDLWWNPAVEQQASDRAYRIGQHKNVMIYRLMSPNTLEKKIDDLIQKKKYLSDIAVANNENWITELDSKQLKELVELRE